MSSSVAGPDCCGGLGNIDFGQVQAARPAGNPGGTRPAEPAARGRRLRRLVGGPTVTRQRGRGVAGEGGCACGRRGSWVARVPARLGREAGSVVWGRGSP